MNQRLLIDTVLAVFVILVLQSLSVLVVVSYVRARYGDSFSKRVKHWYEKNVNNFWAGFVVAFILVCPYLFIAGVLAGHWFWPASD